MTTPARLTAPGVGAYVDVVTRIEALVLARCPRMLRPEPMRGPEVLALAEALAQAARAATNEEIR